MALAADAGRPARSGRGGKEGRGGASLLRISVVRGRAVDREIRGLGTGAGPFLAGQGLVYRVRALSRPTAAMRR